ncbi:MULTISPECIES: enoyl-CoA hydratase/isomerase family protein [unclassified Legionella]|uniref:enoyl-CoA hydratase/isomerase family protein n=1 Tax=unclassified Legionella TaxID=2622702 RepID=UPI001055621D|nr:MULTISPECIES: enoyl-CoA hydratase/isomerase family protein [unclassified Legionella]MDI9818597.1 enoyl-CoA hydratase/isomerase family protein [Legionella sp. PL877]
MTAEIIFSREKHIGLVTLNRPQALNALNLAMIKALQQQLIEWNDDVDIHAVVIQGQGEKAFCAGGDVRWLYEAGLAKNPEQMQFFWHEYRLNHYIHQFKKPYISLMNGMTMGGGVGISLHGSHPVAGERFVFAMPETGIGFFPDIGASYLLSRCPGYTGIYLGLTGNRLNAQDAYALGLIKQVVPSEYLETVLETLINTDLSSAAHERVDACLDEFALAVQDTTIMGMKPSIDSCFSKDTVEDIFKALREKGGEWAARVLTDLEQKAPLSLKVTLTQLQKAKLMPMAECIKMDYCLVNQFMQDSDFYEGIRALLVDKDKSPQWQPDSLGKVTAAKITEYFNCNQDELSLYSLA